MKPQPALVPATALAVALIVFLLPDALRAADAPTVPPDTRQRAEALYAQGRYREALPLLETLDRAGAATGPLLYQLAFCQRSAGDEDAGAETQRRALEALERELVDAKDLEVPFYLANTYQNLGRSGDARRIAVETTSRVQKGEMPQPVSGSGMFQLGKLYEDQDLDAPAAEWYVKAVDLLAEDLKVGGAYVRRASRFVAERAFRQRDYDTAQRYFTALIGAGEGAAADFNRLAVSRARVGLYADAAKAWQQAGLADPQEANRAQYGSSLALLAARLGEVSEHAPSGTTWAELTKEELENLMKEQSARAKEIQAEVKEAGPIGKPERKQYRARLNEVRAVFVPAALEYVLRGHAIRETAFFGGYAPLILNRTAWKLPRPDEKAPKGAEDPAE